MHFVTSLLLSSFGTASAADAPEYLLGDLGVRLDLSKSRWHMSRWSDWDFEAKVEDEPIVLNAWSSPVQTPVSPPEGWGTPFVAKIEGDMKGSDAVIDAVRVEELGGRPVALVDAHFRLEPVGTIALRGAVVEVAGKNLLFSVIAPERLAKVLDRDRAEIARRLELTTPVAPPVYGGAVKNERVTSDLPDGWRELLPGELDAVTPPLVKLGLEDLTGCWTALHPRAGAAPDVMVTCPKKLHLGVVDEHSFTSFDPVVREKLFGALEPGAPVPLADRTGFLYAPREGLAMGVAPDGELVSVTWALGEGAMDEAVREVVASSTFPEPHAVSVGDTASYWLTSRWTSPVVLGPLCCLCGGGTFVLALVGGLVLLRGRRAPSEDDE